MRPATPILVCAFLAGAAVKGFGSASAWEAVIPATVPHLGLVAFHGGLEAADGDFLLAGADADAEYFVRLDSVGKLRSVSRTPHSRGFPSRYLELYETTRGVVSLWACCGNPGWTAVLYDHGGQVTVRMDLGYPRGLLDISTEARMVFLTSAQGAPGVRRTRISAESRSLAGEGAWKIGLTDAIMEEVVGIHALDRGAVAVLDREGGPFGDTLKIWKLDSEGSILWSKDVPTGIKVPGYADYKSIVWTRLAHDAVGRILIAGLPQQLPLDAPPPDSLALAVLEPEGSLLWLKRLPLQGFGEPVARGFWEILSLSADAYGIRVRLYRRGAANYWKTVEIPWSGESIETSLISPIAGGNYGFFQALPSSADAYVGFGAANSTSGMTGPDRLDSIWRPTSLSTPILYGPARGPGGEWRKHSLSEYADTVWSRTREGPAGRTPESTPGPGLEFLLDTRDGGALVGGRLWRRIGNDTLMVIALKFSPAGWVSVQPQKQDHQPKGAWRDGAYGFDATGRFLNTRRSPLLSFPPKPAAVE